MDACICECAVHPMAVLVQTIHSISMQFLLYSFASHNVRSFFIHTNFECVNVNVFWATLYEFEWEWILLYPFDGKNRQMIENCGKQNRENVIDFCCSLTFFHSIVDIDKTNGQTFWGGRAHTHIYISIKVICIWH